jgi:hypothetical protein
MKMGESVRRIAHTRKVKMHTAIYSEEIIVKYCRRRDYYININLKGIEFEGVG